MQILLVGSTLGKKLDSVFLFLLDFSSQEMKYCDSASIQRSPERRPKANLHTSSDPLIMQQTVATCKAHNILVGAHPGLPDIQGFGRREISMSPEELTAMTRYQIGALKAFLDAEGVPLNHVKPHGVLYGMMYRNKETCRAVYEGVPKGTRVFGLAGTFHEEVAKELGLLFTAELYGDVKYNSNGTLVIDRKKKYVFSLQVCVK
jgi:lactam utilization protein B